MAGSSETQNRPEHRVAPPETTPAPLASSARFRVIGELGRGVSGTVYEVHEVSKPEPVALKLLHGFMGPSPMELRSARHVASLRHPNLVRVHEIGELSGRAFYTMELVAGAELESHILARAPTERSAAQRAALRQLMLGLQALHASHHVHLDIKPANLRFTPEGRLVVLDLGLVRDLRSTADDPVGAGTPAYMAPEQALGGNVEPRTDVYAAGAVLYRLLTGRPPHDPKAERSADRRAPPVPPQACDDPARVDPSLAQLAMEMLSESAGGRPSPDDVLRRLADT